MTPDTLLKFFVGTYAMTNVSNPSTHYIWGDAPIGHITWTNNYYMSAVMVATEPQWRPIIGGSEADQNNPDLQDEYATIPKHTTSYAAPFRFEPGSNTTSGVVVHGPIYAATHPSHQGQTWTRWYDFYEDGQVLSLRFEENSSNTIWWRRLTPISA